MRIRYPDEIEEMFDKIRPWLETRDGKCVLKKDTPPEIVEMKKKYLEYVTTLNEELIRFA